MKQTEKEIDCVVMKNAIQGRLVARRKGMSPAEYVADVERSLAQYTAPIAAFWRKIRAGHALKTQTRAAAGR